MLFAWRLAIQNGQEKGLESSEDVVPVSQIRQAEAKIRELERLLGKKTVQVEILEEAVRIAREKTHLAREVAKTGRKKMSRVISALGVSRASLYPSETPVRSAKKRDDDAEFLGLIQRILKAKPTFGYRRITASATSSRGP